MAYTCVTVVGQCGLTLPQCKLALEPSSILLVTVLTGKRTYWEAALVRGVAETGNSLYDLVSAALHAMAGDEVKPEQINKQCGQQRSLPTNRTRTL